MTGNPASCMKALTITCILIFTFAARAQVLPPDQVMAMIDWAESTGKPGLIHAGVAKCVGVGRGEDVATKERAWTSRARQLTYAVSIMGQNATIMTLFRRVGDDSVLWKLSPAGKVEITCHVNPRVESRERVDFDPRPFDETWEFLANKMKAEGTESR